jgi:hypothetical protein
VTKPSYFVAAIVFLLACCAALRAQEGISYFHPEKFERATKADDKGLLQWDKHAELKCPTCKGSGKAKCTTCVRFFEDAPKCIECKRHKEREVVCRPCAGTGTMPDPLEKVLCSGCMGASFLLCDLCGGGGRIKITETKWADCPCCKGEGGYKCGVCNGTRLVETAAVKPALKDANVAALAKALAATDASQKAIEAFTPKGGADIRKDVKAFGKLMETAGAVHPSLKRSAKVLEEYMNRVYAGSQYQGHEEKEVNALNRLKGGADYYLKHQRRMLDLAHKRAEANAKLAAEQKGK